MDIRAWDERYRSQDPEAAPSPLLVETVSIIPPGDALDLACGAGRNAIWLAERGWRVTAVDGAGAAIEILRRRAADQGVVVDARVADLEKGEYAIERSSQDLIVMAYYLQRDLIESAKAGLRPGGVLLAIVHTGEEPSCKRARRGELTGYFTGWEILRQREGEPAEAGHKYPVEEIVARRP